MSCWLCPLLLVSLGTAALANNGHGEALALFQRGRTQFRAKRYQRAITILERSLALHEHRNTLYYLGASYRRLGRFRRAHTYYRRYAASFPEAKAARLARRYEQQLRWAPPALLEVRSRPGGATVLVDGVSRGSTPLGAGALRVTLAGGTRRVELRLRGHAAQHWVVQSEYGEPQTRSAVLVREAQTSPGKEVVLVAPGPRGRERGASPSSLSLELEMSLGWRQTLRAGGDVSSGVFGVGLGAGVDISLGDRWLLGGHLTLRYRFPEQDAGAVCALLGAGLSRRVGVDWRVELRVLAGGTFYLVTEGDNDLLRGAAPVDVDGVLGVLTAAASLALLRHLGGSFWLRVPLEAQFSVVGAAAQLPATWVNRVLFGVGLRWG